MPEAMYELGLFDQSIADKTINKLRKRAHVADMVLTDITTDFDPERDQDVNPLLWEIRRERRVELMGEGTRLGRFTPMEKRTLCKQTTYWSLFKRCK